MKEIDTQSTAPLHMDKDARNRRLAQHLVAQGFFVEEVLEPPQSGVSQRIDYLKVSAALPSPSHSGA